MVARTLYSEPQVEKRKSNQPLFSEAYVSAPRQTGNIRDNVHERTYPERF